MTAFARPDDRARDSRARSDSVPFRAVLLPGLVAFAVHVVVLVALCSAAGLVLTHVLDDSALVAFDRRVVRELAAARTRTLDRLTGFGTLPADPLPVAIVWFGAVALLAVRTRRWPAPCLVMLAVGGEKLSYLLTTLIVRRPRPDVPTIGERHATSSFPSGHVGSAISLWGVLALLVLAGFAARPTHSTRSTRAKVLAALPVVIIAIDVALCRMYRGHHYPTDVFFGAIVGTAWIVFAVRIVARLDVDPRLPSRRGGAGTDERRRRAWRG